MRRTAPRCARTGRLVQVAQCREIVGAVQDAGIVQQRQRGRRVRRDLVHGAIGEGAQAQARTCAVGVDQLDHLGLAPDVRGIGQPDARAGRVRA